MCLKKQFINLFAVSLCILGNYGIAASVQAATEKPNILFIMGDDIGLYNVGVYHHGLMVGEMPNIDPATLQPLSP